MLFQILPQLIEIIDQQLGRGTSDHFLSVFYGTEFYQEISKYTTFESVKLSGNFLFNGYSNLGSSGVYLDFQFTPDCSDFNSLFRSFCYSTAHSNVVGDVRDYVDEFYEIYFGPRYFAFHGDGNCVLLGLLFQALAGRYRYQIDLKYSTARERDFMHVFGYFVDHQGVDYFVDPD